MLRRRASWQSRPSRLQRCALVVIDFINHEKGEARPKICHLQPWIQENAGSAMRGCMRVPLAGAGQGRWHASRAGSTCQRPACAWKLYHRCSRKSRPPRLFQQSPPQQPSLWLRPLTAAQESRRKAQQELAEARSSEQATQQRGTALTKDVANLRSQVGQSDLTARQPPKCSCNPCHIGCRTAAAAQSTAYTHLLSPFVCTRLLSSSGRT